MYLRVNTLPNHNQFTYPPQSTGAYQPEQNDCLAARGTCMYIRRALLVFLVCTFALLIVTGGWNQHPRQALESRSPCAWAAIHLIGRSSEQISRAVSPLVIDANLLEFTIAHRRHASRLPRLPAPPVLLTPTVKATQLPHPHLVIHASTYHVCKIVVDILLYARLMKHVEGKEKKRGELDQERTH